jgi:hypothetical protein
MTVGNRERACHQKSGIMSIKKKNIVISYNTDIFALDSHYIIIR